MTDAIDQHRETNESDHGPQIAHDCNCGGPIRWRAAFTKGAGELWPYLTRDKLRQSFWARSSVSQDAGFSLTFADGTETFVEVLEEAEPERLRLLYFGSDVEIRIGPSGAGSIVEVTDDGPAGPDWRERYAGWVNWLLMFKARAEHGVDLRNGQTDRGWASKFADV